MNNYHKYTLPQALKSLKKKLGQDIVNDIKFVFKKKFSILLNIGKSLMFNKSKYNCGKLETVLPFEIINFINTTEH